MNILDSYIGATNVFVLKHRFSANLFHPLPILRINNFQELPNFFKT